MMEKRKARPTVPAAEQANEKTGRTAKFPQFDSNTDNCKTQVAGVLLHGAENAIPARQLVKVLGLKSTRELRLLVSDERERNSLILADEHGYYLPGDGEAGRSEIRRFERTMHARAIHTLRVTKAARRALEKLPGQLEISTPVSDKVGESRQR